MLIVRPWVWMKVCGVCLCALGAGVLLGWALDIAALKAVVPGLITMKANTAVGLLLGGLALVLLGWEKPGAWLRLAGGACAAGVTLLGGVTLAEFLLEWNAGIDEFLFADTGYTAGMTEPGRMAATTAFCFVLTGAALWTGFRRDLAGAGYSFISALGASVLGMGVIFAFGQAVSVVLELPFWNYFGMAVLTATGFILLGMGLLAFVKSRRGLTWALDRKTTVGFGLSMVVLLGVAMISWNHTYQLKVAIDWVGHSQEVLREIEDVRAKMAELESSQRGFILLGDESLLSQREATKGKIDRHLAVLERLIADDPEQRGRLEGLRGLISRRTGFGEETIRARAREGILPAQEMLRTGTGVRLTQEIQDALNGIRGEEEARLGRRRQEERNATATAFLVLPLGVLLGLTILAVAVFWLNAGVSERDETQARLKESETEFRTMVDAIPQLAWMARADGYVFWFNQRWLEYTGTTLKEMEGWGWQKAYDPAYMPKIQEVWGGAIATGESVELEFPIRGASGEWGWFLTRATALKDEKGRVLRWFGTSTDLSQNRAAAAEIQRLNASLEQRVAERTAELEAANKELGAFSYSVSHDLRAPLRAVDGFSQAVLEDYGDLLPAEGKKYLQTVREGAQRMGRLIDDLLEFSKLSRVPMNKQEIDTGAQVRGLLEGLSHLREGRDVEVRIGKLPVCHGAPSMLDQVWVNLLSNALKYTRKKEGAVIEVGCEVQDGENVFFVRDNGAGFDMKFAGKLFGVFQRLHRADEFEGTGVGLAIVQRIVHRHGGRVWAQAEPGRGAVFYFTLEGKAGV